MRKMSEEERNRRLDRVPCMSVMPFVNLEEVQAWVEHAVSVSADLKERFAIGSNERVGYAKITTDYLRSLVYRNPRRFCAVPVDLLLTLRLFAMGTEERQELATSICTAYKEVVRHRTRTAFTLNVMEYPVEFPSREALRLGRPTYGSTSVNGIVEMFRGLCISLCRCEEDIEVVLDSVLGKALPGSALGLDIAYRDRSRYDAKGERQYLPEHQVYRLHKRKGEHGGTMLICATRLEPAVDMITSIIRDASKSTKIKRTCGDPKIVFYKIAATVGTTISEGLILSKKKTLLYSKEVFFG